MTNFYQSRTRVNLKDDEKVGLRNPPPSHNYVYWHKENEKRRRGVDNLIDRADIIAASLGVKNAWKKAYDSQPAAFEGVLREHSVDWQILLAIKINPVSPPNIQIEQISCYD